MSTQPQYSAKNYTSSEDASLERVGDFVFHKLSLHAGIGSFRVDDYEIAWNGMPIEC